MRSSQAGGVVIWRSGLPRPIFRQLPRDLALLPVWTGRSASTADFVRGVLDSGAELNGLIDAAERAIAAALAEDFLAAVQSFYRALEQLERRSGVPIVAGPHARIAALTSRLGAAYKPSGAGGGDVGLVCCRADAAARVREDLQAQGVEFLDLRLGAPGAMTHAEELRA